ncbi:MAG: hypothetical protein M5U28_23025 [Sandaracinaceae bacterium]|nr:hypothetical protein [Sandaracinaceae bacterium]
MDGVTLQVVGADGALWGPPLPLVTGERNVGGVDCGWNGREVVVVWWRAAGDGAWEHHLLAARAADLPLTMAAPGTSASTGGSCARSASGAGRARLRGRARGVKCGHTDNTRQMFGN